VSITVDRKQSSQPWVGMAQFGPTYADSRRARILSGLMLSRLDRKTAVAMGISESGKTLQQRLEGKAGNAFLVARDPMSRMGFFGDEATSVGHIGTVHGAIQTGQRAAHEVLKTLN